MKIVIAPDSFKESLSAMEVATVIEQGFKQVFPHADYVKVPMADGGEGTVQSLVDATGGRIIACQVTNPLGQPVEGFYGLLGDGDTAVIEMAAASGLHLVPQASRNPLCTTSYGTGELILAALNHNVKRIIVGLGGSATNDAGLGMLQALGVQCLDAQGLALPAGGSSLNKLATIDLSTLDTRLQQVELLVACDVDNPLCGPHGASAVFGPQKGATPEIVETLDQALKHFADVVKKDLNKDILSLSGGGAAGGMGATLVGVLNAELQPGVDIVIEAIKLDSLVQDADLVITGEGRIDSQTIHGKTPIGVARTAKRYGRKVIAIAGCFTPDYGVVHDHGLDAVFAIVNRSVDLDTALQEAELNLLQTSSNIARLLKLA
ncbi:glycerate kinase [Vibrio diazotrophicus]|jgi:glycerate kinase|nr:glycerate kinase [Vibrio diazotrophicus]